MLILSQIKLFICVFMQFLLKIRPQNPLSIEIELLGLNFNEPNSGTKRSKVSLFTFF